MPKVSIIIPFNNGKKYLDKCLKCLNKIEYNDYEIILIDDFSNDNSENIIKRFKNINIKYYYTDTQTKGVGNARNIGIEKANGKYIMFLDVDDTIDENLLRDLEEYMNKDVDMIKFKMKIISNKKEEYEKGPAFDIIKGEDAFNKLCYKDNYLDSPCLYLMKKELFNKKSLRFEKNVYHEDFGLIPLLIINSKSVISTNIYGYNYYQTKNSIMRNSDYLKTKEKVNDKFYLYEKLKNNINSLDLKQDTISNVLEYYTNSIIFSLKSLKKEDRYFFVKKMKKAEILNNIKAKSIRKIIKKYILKFNFEIFLKYKES